ncbi:hypothetical protein [Streptomyces sp. NPDC058486]|uniref:AMP-binding enzyme n=1 Tax=unclassified Streptomyces TaxID=2593676 RepID=UPI00364F13CA
MARYWNRPEETAAAIPDGWFRTGDLARRDEDGYIFIVDRKKDLIIRGGYNVYPREVEEVLYEPPDVVEAAVVGIPHETLGEDVAAAVVLAPQAHHHGGRTASLREGPRRSLQVHPRHLASAHPAEGPDRKDHQAGDPPAPVTTSGGLV